MQDKLKLLTAVEDRDLRRSALLNRNEDHNMDSLQSSIKADAVQASEMLNPYISVNVSPPIGTS